MKERKLKKVNVKIIHDYMKKNVMNEKEFAEVCGITEYTLKKILDGSRNLIITNYIKVAKVLNVSMRDLLGY